MAWFMNVHRSFWTIMIDTISDRWCTMLQCLVQPLPGWWRNREVSLAYPASIRGHQRVHDSTWPSGRGGDSGLWESDTKEVALGGYRCSVRRFGPF